MRPAKTGPGEFDSEHMEDIESIGYLSQVYCPSRHMRWTDHAETLKDRGTAESSQRVTYHQVCSADRHPECRRLLDVEPEASDKPEDRADEDQYQSDASISPRDVLLCKCEQNPSSKHLKLHECVWPNFISHVGVALTKNEERDICHDDKQQRAQHHPPP